MSDQRRLTPTSTDLAMLRFFRPSLLSWSGVLARVNWAWAFVAVASLCCIALQSNVYLNHDVGWVLYSSGLMLDGQVLSRDIIEPNPPLIYFLSALPALAAGGSGWAPGSRPGGAAVMRLSRSVNPPRSHHTM